MNLIPQLFDYEFKYRFEEKDIHHIRHWVNQSHIPDPHHPEYIVASHYYDVEDLHRGLSFPESELPTDKYRLRQYKLATDKTFNGCYTEFKSRMPSGKRIKIKKEFNYSSSELDPMRVHGSEIFNSSSIKGFLNLKYSLTMTYSRERFIHPVLPYSLCLDTDIQVVNSRHMNNTFHSLVKCPVYIIEVKTSDPAVLKHLNFPPSAIDSKYFSKYKYACELSFKKDNK